MKCPGLSGTENVNKRTNITLDVTSYAEGFTSELLFQPSCLRSVDEGLNLSAMRAVFSAFLGALLSEGGLQSCKRHVCWCFCASLEVSTVLVILRTRELVVL